MLAFILLVVLGGGVGLLAVSLAESSKPATDAGSDRRGPGPDDDADEPENQPVPEPVDEPRAPTRPPVERRPRRTPDPRNVPRAYTAIEGRFADVARAPLWRRILSIIGIVLIAVALGVGLAAVFGAIIGALAEILGNTIG